jgi:hypothetical protein
MSTPIITVAALAAFTLFMAASLLNVAPSQAPSTPAPVAVAAQTAQANG